MGKTDEERHRVVGRRHAQLEAGGCASGTHVHGRRYSGL